jgi:serum/glucocorticoid-regulated kinase 2
MSWAKLGKKSRPALAPEDSEMPGRSTTPTPGNPNGGPVSRSGQISFRCVRAIA